jgi:hypothetical protein
MEQSPFNTPGKLLLEKITPRNPLSGVDNSLVDIPAALPSKKIVTLDKLESSQNLKEELVNPYARSLHHRYRSGSSLETKHKKVLEENPNAFRKKHGECGTFLVEVSQCDRLQSWKPSDQRKPHKESNSHHLNTSKSLDHLPDNEFTRTLISTADAKRSRGTRSRFGSTDSSNMSVNSGMSALTGVTGNTTGSRCNTAASDDDSVSSTESDDRNSPPGSAAYSRAGRSTNSRARSVRKPKREPHPSTHSTYLIKSLELEPYELNDDMSMTSHLSMSSSLQQRHEEARIKKMKAFEKTYSKLREASRTDREHTKQLIKNGEKGPPNPEDVRATIRNEINDAVSSINGIYFLSIYFFVSNCFVTLTLSNCFVTYRFSSLRFAIRLWIC